MTIREKICGFENLHNAAYKCSKQVSWKDSVAGYRKNILTNTLKLQQSLYEDKYQISRYSQFKVHEPKERDVVSTRFKDRVFQRSLCEHYLITQLLNDFSKHCAITLAIH